jgi:hypothetical protein
MEIPRLFLALEGFSPTQRATMVNWLEAEEREEEEISDVHWTISSSSDADAVLMARPTSVRIESRTDEEALPSAVMWSSKQEQDDEDMEVSHQHFLMMLIELSQLVQLQCQRFVLGSQLAARYRAREPMKGLWHVRNGNALLAVVDFERLKVSIRGETHVVEFEHAEWIKRSEQAVAPPNFSHCSLEQMMWHYTRRTLRMLLPQRFTLHPVSLRRLPRLPLRLMGEQSLLIIAILRQQSLHLSELAARLGFSPEQASRLLASLYFAGTITTRPAGLWRRMAETLRLKPSSPFAESTRLSSISDATTQGTGVFGLNEPPKPLL